MCTVIHQFYIGVGQGELAVWRDPLVPDVLFEFLPTVLVQFLGKICPNIVNVFLRKKLVMLFHVLEILFSLFFDSSFLLSKSVFEVFEGEGQVLLVYNSFLCPHFLLA